MIERVARAIYEADDPWSSAFEWPTMGSEKQSADEYRRIARAAIEAMMEPTEAMSNISGDGTSTSRRIYQAMLREALK
jgi:hypothetical protein